MSKPPSVSIEGRWQMVRAELAGEEAPEMVAPRTVVEFASGTYIVRFDGEIADEGSFEVRETIPYKTIVLQGTKGINAGRTIPGIYQLIGHRLRICYGMDGITPTDFSTSASETQYMVVYKRLSKSEP
jgi:uncharacterized protein (TIGR03067 family)